MCTAFQNKLLTHATLESFLIQCLHYFSNERLKKSLYSFKLVYLFTQVLTCNEGFFCFCVSSSFFLFLLFILIFDCETMGQGSVAKLWTNL